MPTPSRSDLQARALAHATDGTAQFGPLALLIIGAILSACISHLAEKCLDSLDAKSLRHPGPIRRWQLRRLVRERCGDPGVIEAASPGGLDARALDHAYGDAAYAGLIAAAAGLSDAEAAGLCGNA